ncbi:MAG TPA: hypothetical protein VFY45_05270 [Baekduia sp.]|nr:hypothetical protein [Baekduia sp.]
MPGLRADARIHTADLNAASIQPRTASTSGTSGSARMAPMSKSTTTMVPPGRSASNWRRRISWRSGRWNSSRRATIASNGCRCARRAQTSAVGGLKGRTLLDDRALLLELVHRTVKTGGIDAELLGDLADGDAGARIDQAQDVLLSA